MSGVLWTDLITPAEITGYARAAQEALELRWGSLSRYLPNQFVNDIVAQFEVGARGLLPVAKFRSYDTETPLGQTQGRQKVFIELPPIGEKMRISEYDQLRQRDGNLRDTVVTNSLLQLTDTIVTDVSTRLEVARGQALELGELDIAENGFIQGMDFERDPSLEVDASTGLGEYWIDHDDATPLEQLTTWVEAYETINNERPASILTSRRVVSHLARCAEFRNLYSTLVGRPSVVNRAAVNEVMADHELPPFDYYERSAVFDNGDGGGVKTRKILSGNKLFLLPAPGQAQNGLGATYWGQTLEADEPEYGLEPAELPGIVAGVWKTRDPIGLWVHCNAIALAVLGDANMSMVATVLPDGS